MSGWMLIQRARLWLKWNFGKLLNLAGYPPIIRRGTYGSSLGTVVTVSTSPFYTIINVNGLDIYFNRFSGTYDGVGGAPAVFDVAKVELLQQEKKG